MSTSHPIHRFRLLPVVSTAVAFLVVSACAAELPTEPVEALTVQMAKGGKPDKTGPVQETPLAVTFEDRTGDGITSDGLFAGRYEDGHCGVAAHFNSTSDDALLDPDASKIRRKDQAACGTDARHLTFDLGFTTAEGGFMNVDQVRTVATSKVRRAQFNIGPCNRLVFDPTEFSGTNYVEVERIDDSTWHVFAEPGFAMARCVDLGVDVDMPFSAIVQALP